MDKILKELNSFGLDVSAVKADGIIHRINSNAKDKKNLSGWYAAKEFNGHVYCNYGCWIRGENGKVSSNEDGHSISNGKVWEELQQIYEYEQEERLNDGILKATAFVNHADCYPANEGHPYLEAKQIFPSGTLQRGEDLIIPVICHDGRTTSYQSIKPDGFKKFMPGGVVGGGCYVIPGSDEKICVCEGFATGATISRCTGFKVLVAFNAGNLKKIVDMATGNIIVCADNDHTKDINAGLTAGRACTKDNGYQLVYPTGIKGSDFNDMFVELGYEAVRDAVLKGHTVELYKPDKKTKMDLPEPTGILKEIADYYNETAIKPQPLFGVAAGLIFASIILGRRYRTDFDNYTSMYFLLIAKSGTGKDHPKSVIRKLLKECNLCWLERAGGFTAANTVLRSLEKQPLQIAFFEEIGQKLSEAGKKQQSNTSGMFRQLLDVWSSCHTSSVGDEFADGSVPRCIRPALTIAGLTTPKEFFDKSVNESLIEQGFINRLLPFISDEERKPTKLKKRVKNRANLDKIKQWAFDHFDVGGTGNVNDLRSIIEDPGEEFKKNPFGGDCEEIPFSDESIDFFNEYEVELCKIADGLEKVSLDDMISRNRELAMRIALIACLSDEETTIELKHSQWARDVVDALYGRYVQRVKKHLSGSEFEDMKMEALRSLRFKPVKPADMPKIKPFSKWDKKTRNEILSELQDSGLADLTKMKDKKKRGPGTKVWVAIG